MCHFYCTEGYETWVFGTWIGGLSYVARISDCDEPFLRKFSESGKIIGRDADNRHAALAWDGGKVDFACASGGEGPVLQ